jgi:hypothetical protein
MHPSNRLLDCRFDDYYNCYNLQNEESYVRKVVILMPLNYALTIPFLCSISTNIKYDSHESVTELQFYATLNKIELFIYASLQKNFFL